MLSPENTSRPHLMKVLVFLTFLSLACLSCADDSDVTEQERTQSEYPAGISRLLFKHMRFRELPETTESEDETFGVPDSRSWSNHMSDEDLNLVHPAFYRGVRNPSSNQYMKRQQQELVNNLAALLADGRGKNSGSTLRMPSLRFG